MHHYIYLWIGIHFVNHALHFYNELSLQILIIIVDIFICLILYVYTCIFHAFGISNRSSAYCIGIVYVN